MKKVTKIMSKKNKEKFKEEIIKKDKHVMFKEFLDAVGLEIKAVDFGKVRNQIVTTKGSFSADRFKQNLLAKYLKSAIKFKIVDLLYTEGSQELTSVVERYAQEYISKEGGDKGFNIPPEYEGLTLNLDEGHQGRELKFFLTTPDELLTHVSGAVYMRTLGMAEAQAVAMARKVVPVYEPQKGRGVFERIGDSGQKQLCYNTYVVPEWKAIKVKPRSEPPELIRKIVDHIFPIELEREYFYRWVRRSIEGRSPTILVLTGTGGIGKNRLNILLRALHGHSNKVDGKRSSLSGTFNSQLAETTLIWFDELTYDMSMENTLKELPNDSIAIERKGIDSTRSTKLHASIVISNNKERDNFIAFDARKFVPLVMNTERLESCVDPEDIKKFTAKVEDRNSPDFDPKFLAKFVAYLKSIPYNDEEIFPNMEYRGPMFWRLAQTSMSRWQKNAVDMVMTTERTTRAGAKAPYHKYRGFLWSDLEKLLLKQKASNREVLADHTTVRAFFDKYRDGVGEKVFKTFPKEDSLLGDFYIKILDDVELKSGKDLTTSNEVERISNEYKKKANRRRQNKIHYARKKYKEEKKLKKKEHIEKLVKDRKQRIKERKEKRRAKV